MKTYTTVVALMMIAALGNAQDAGSTIDRTYFADAARYEHISAGKVAESYLSCLGSGNDGVVESALSHIATLKLSMPVRNFKPLLTKVIELTQSAPSAELRYKAFLTRMVLEEPAIFRSVAATEYGSPDELFGALASRISTHVAAR